MCEVDDELPRLVWMLCLPPHGPASPAIQSTRAVADRLPDWNLRKLPRRNDPSAHAARAKSGKGSLLAPCAADPGGRRPIDRLSRCLGVRGRSADLLPGADRQRG